MLPGIDGFELMDYIRVTDSKYISKLSVEDQNVFQRMWDEIKYLCKIATAGSQEAKAFAKLQREFERVYREAAEQKNTADGGTNYSLYYRPDFNKAEWDIVNRRKFREFDNPKYDLDNDRKWMYANEKGTTVFAVYSKHDADDPTVLYGSRGKKAEQDYARLTKFFEEGKGYATHGRTTFDRILSDIQSTEGNASNGISPSGQRGAADGNVFLPFEESRSNGTGDYGDGTGSFQAPLTEEYNPEASDDSGASFVTFSNDYATIRNFMKEGSSGSEEGDVKYSLVEDQETIDFLENQEHMTVYKAMAMHDGKLYPPMASQEFVTEEYTTKKGEKKTRRVRKLKNPSVLGQWQQSDERPDLIKSFQPPSAKYPDGYGKFDLLKSNGKTTGDVAYNPYEHTSNIVLNDQFSEAYQRPELVTVEYRIPVSELTSGYKAKYAKDAVGLADWKAGRTQTVF